MLIRWVSALAPIALAAMIVPSLGQFTHAATPSEPMPILKLGGQSQQTESSVAPADWRLVEEPPRLVPIPTLHAGEPVGDQAVETQRGVPVLIYWVEDGVPQELEPDPPFRWPTPLAIQNDRVSIDLGTSVKPGPVEVRLFRAVSDEGLPLEPAPSKWCYEESSDSGCTLTQKESESTWWVIVLLEPPAGTYFLSLRGTWLVPRDSPARALTGWPTFDVGWLFAAKND